MRDRDEIANAFLVGLGAPDSHEQALGRFLEVLDVEGDELGAAKRTSKAKQQQRSIAESAKIGRHLCQDGADRLCRGRRLTCCGCAYRSPNAGKNSFDRFAARWRLEASHAVHVANAGAAAGDG